MFDEQMVELSRHIGGGREAPGGTMTLSMEYRPENDLCWKNGYSAGGGQAIWCESRALSDWLYPEYPVETFADYDEHFYPVLTALAFNVAEDFLTQARFTPKTLIPSALGAGWYPVLTIRRNNQQLSLVLVGWAPATLRQLTLDWQSWNSPTASPLLPFALSVGYRLLSAEKILALQAGDGIVLQSTAAISENQLWLYLQEKRITMSVNENELEVVSMSSGAEKDAVTGMLTDITRLPLRVVAEVGVAHMALNDLAEVAPGMIFPTRAALSGEVRLTVNGVCIGLGSLIALNDSLVVRIDFLMNGGGTRPKSPPTIVTDEQGSEGEGGDGLAG